MTRYQRDKENGICVRCHHNKAADGVLTCPSCRVKTNNDSKDKRVWLKQNGICVNCGCEKALPYKTRCWDCNEKNLNHKTNYSKEQKTSYAKQYRDSYTEKGICYSCRTRKIKVGCKQCVTCLKRKSIKQETRRRENGILPRGERANYGECYFCGKPIMKGKKVCEDHYYKNCTNLKVARAKIDSEIENLGISRKRFFENFMR